MRILETRRLILREFVPEDVDELARILSDAETMRYYPVSLDRLGVEQWIGRNRERYERDRVGLWAMVLKLAAQDADNRVVAEGGEADRARAGEFALASELIGDCGIVLQEVDGERLYEIGYHLRRDLWGKGLATEAARACRDWGFENLESDRLISLIRPENVASRRVAERNGMNLWKEVMWRGFLHSVYCVERPGASSRTGGPDFAAV